MPYFRYTVSNLFQVYIIPSLIIKNNCLYAKHGHESFEYVNLLQPSLSRHEIDYVLRI